MSCRGLLPGFAPLALAFVCRGRCVPGFALGAVCFSLGHCVRQGACCLLQQASLVSWPGLYLRWGLCPHPRRRPPPTAHRPSPAALPWGIVLGGPRALGRIGVSIAFTSYHSFCVCYSFKSHFFIWEYWECLSCPWLCFRVWQYFVLIVCHCGVIGVMCRVCVISMCCCAIGVWWALL